MDQLGGAGESQFSTNVRFQIAKGQIDQLFNKWLALSTTDKLINMLVSEINKPGPVLSAPPSPIFISKIQTPHSPKGHSHTPPRSPSGEKYMGRTLSPKTSGQMLLGNASGQGQTLHDSDPNFHISNSHQSNQDAQSKHSQDSNGYPFSSAFSKTDGNALASMVSSQNMLNQDGSGLQQQSNQGQLQKQGQDRALVGGQAFDKRSGQQQKTGGTPQPIKSSKFNEQQSPLSQNSGKQPQDLKNAPQTPPRKKHQQQVEAQPARREHVPAFYHPGGKPIPQTEIKEFTDNLDKIFGTGPQGTKQIGKETAFEAVLDDLLKVPKIFRDMVFVRILKVLNLPATAMIGKPQFMKFWDDGNYRNMDPKRRMFTILCQPDVKYLVNSDFAPMFTYLLEHHPGLEFLQATPEFQERYADTVVMRVFYALDANDDGRITYRDYKNSDLNDVFFQVANEEDINKVRLYFSYEHFYVLYCRFWELDTDHDFFIDKEDFSRYEGHALSRKAVDRIFDQVPRKFKSDQKDKMGYEDFVWFMLSEEDKTTVRSLQYWFTIIDLDENGTITPHEMDYFYEEQVHRLEYLNHEPILFVDLLCQMNDMIKPTPTEGHFNLKQLRTYLPQVGIFFNCLVNLNKFIAYETRDLFAIKHQLTEFPDYTEWDRFAKGEYERLSMEEEGGDDSEMIDAMEGWDSDQDDATSATNGAANGNGGGAGAPAEGASSSAQALAGGVAKGGPAMDGS